MTAIVMNTLNGFVSEYDWAFPALCATHAGDDSGLYALGGSKDAAAPINGAMLTGKTLRTDTLKNAIESAYLSLRGDEGSRGLFIVEGSDQWQYPVNVLDPGVARAKPGRGIRENLLAFGYQNVDGAYFELDRIELRLLPSKQRRI